MTSPRLKYLLLSIAILGTLGCDGYDPARPFPTAATTILSLEVIPNLVVSGDSLIFRAVVADSLRDDLTFGWFLGIRPRVGTRIPVHRTVATEPPGTYNIAVHISRDGFQRVNANMDFQVIADVNQ
ncbi:MAG: hypothetical protein ACI9BV_003909 [Rhodothermales bacterium]|jgi:hypothetical protein